KRFTLYWLLRDFTKDFLMRLWPTALTFLGGAMIVSLLTLIGNVLGIISALVFFLIIFLIEKRRDEGWFILSDKLLQRSTYLVAAATFAASIYLPFWKWNVTTFLPRTGMLIGVFLGASILVCIFRMFFYKPFVLDWEICPDCGVVGNRLEVYQTNSHSDEYAGPGRLIRRVDGYTLVFRYKCPKCKREFNYISQH
ncbi:hypothetical protein JW926_12895, partial [Candidatus Sumerlaeota bacterium]|nr:hypothetical protein [Candidatus Sumerlaeota bacterium]